LASLELYPAVDILGGKAVRLVQGDFERGKVYEADPLDAARRWSDAGARRLHVVDLDGARAGEPRNVRQLERIASALDVTVQYGGGLRTSDHALAALEAGAARVVIGTAAFAAPELLDRVLADAPERIAVAIDVREGRVATSGWLERTELTAREAVARLEERAVRRFVYTSVDVDGTFGGPAIDELSELVATSDQAEFLYSGGIGSLDDLRALAALELERLTGVIVGKALYEREFTVGEALEALATGRKASM
jgi:phosphoribosylformimino-5-aminoimidazole carboxamide ribotide isomerase